MLTCHNTILILKDLMRRGFQGPGRCSMWGSANEEVVHLLLGCPFAITIWQEVLHLTCGILLKTTILFPKRE